MSKIKVLPNKAPIVSLLLERISKGLRAVQTVLLVDNASRAAIRAAVPEDSWPMFWTVSQQEVPELPGLAQRRPLACYAKALERWSAHPHWLNTSPVVAELSAQTDCAAAAKADTMQLLHLTSSLLQGLASKVLAIDGDMPVLADIARLRQMLERTSVEAVAL